MNLVAMSDGHYPITDQHSANSAWKLRGSSKHHTKAEVEKHIAAAVKKLGLKHPKTLEKNAGSEDNTPSGAAMDQAESASTSYAFDDADVELFFRLSGGSSCSLDEKPGSNWVQAEGGLPNYICRIARAIKQSGHDTSSAVAIAVSRAKVWGAGGGNVSEATRAKAAEAAAQWEALKAKAHAKSGAHKVATTAKDDPDFLRLTADSPYPLEQARKAIQEMLYAKSRAVNANKPKGSTQPTSVESDYDSPGWVREVWSDAILVDNSDGTIDRYPIEDYKDGVFSFGDPQKVKIEYVPADLTDELLEKLIGQDVQGKSDGDEVKAAASSDSDNDGDKDAPDAKAALVASLKDLLTDNISFYLKAHGYHWNVQGPDFAQYHALFSSIYEDAFEDIDPLAENIRKLGSFPPFRVNDVASQQDAISEDKVKTDPMALATDLLASNTALLSEIADALDKAADADQQGILNFLADMEDRHQKWGWQLRASTGGDDPGIKLSNAMVRLARHVRTEEGAKLFGKPIGALLGGKELSDLGKYAHHTDQQLKDAYAKLHASKAPDAKAQLQAIETEGARRAAAAAHAPKLGSGPAGAPTPNETAIADAQGMLKAHSYLLKEHAAGNIKPGSVDAMTPEVIGLHAQRAGVEHKHMDRALDTLRSPGTNKYKDNGRSSELNDKASAPSSPGATDGGSQVKGPDTVTPPLATRLENHSAGSNKFYESSVHPVGTKFAHVMRYGATGPTKGGEHKANTVSVKHYATAAEANKAHEAKVKSKQAGGYQPLTRLDQGKVLDKAAQHAPVAGVRTVKPEASKGTPAADNAKPQSSRFVPNSEPVKSTPYNQGAAQAKGEHKTENIYANHSTAKLQRLHDTHKKAEEALTSLATTERSTPNRTARAAAVYGKRAAEHKATRAEIAKELASRKSGTSDTAAEVKRLGKL